MLDIKRRRIYFDSAATTPLLPSVKEKMIETMECYGNPSSLYELGQASHRLIGDCRAKIAGCIGCLPEEIIFTSGGTEADNTALISTYDYAKANGLGNHIITSKIEHHAILNTSKYLEEYCGAEVTYVGVDEYGKINPKDVGDAMRDETCIVSLMGANNEVGTVQDLSSAYYRNGHNIFHSDCVQLFGHQKINLKNLDMMSMSAHKIGGPKGVGFLYVKGGVLLPSFMHGGGQERGRRASTENILGIIGMTEAIVQATEHLYEWNNYVWDLTSHMKQRILDEISGVKYNGHPTFRLPGILNFSFDGIRGEELMILLDSYGICVSTGSACNSSSNEPSHVLLAMGLSEEQANSSVRFSLSQNNTMEEVDFTVDRLKKLVEFMRSN